MNITRRHALASATGLCGLAALSACTTTTANGVTTVTLNVAQVVAWGNALVNGANMVASLPGISGLPAAAPVAAIGALIANDLAAFAAASGGAVTLSFNSTSVPSAVASLEADVNSLLVTAQKTVTGVAATYLSTAQTYINAIETVVSLIQAATASVPMLAKAGAAPMGEAQAMTILSGK